MGQTKWTRKKEPKHIRLYASITGSDGRSGVETEQRKQANPPAWANLADLRVGVVRHLGSSEPGEQSRLANSLGIPAGTLSKFISGRNLPAKYLDVLAEAVMAF